MSEVELISSTTRTYTMEQFTDQLMLGLILAESEDDWKEHIGRIRWVCRPYGFNRRQTGRIVKKIKTGRMGMSQFFETLKAKRRSMR